MISIKTLVIFTVVSLIFSQVALAKKKKKKKKHHEEEYQEEYQDEYKDVPLEKDDKSFIVGFSTGLSKLTLTRGTDSMDAPAAISLSVWADHFFTPHLAVGLVYNIVSVDGAAITNIPQTQQIVPTRFTYSDSGIFGTASWYLTPTKPYSLVLSAGYGSRNFQFTRDRLINGVDIQDTNQSLGALAPLVALSLNDNVGKLWVLSSRVEYWAFSTQQINSFRTGQFQQFSISATSLSINFSLGLGF